MQTLGYYNGEIGELADMKVPMLDRACYFGDGLYEVVYTRKWIPYALDEHIDRFFKGCARLGIVPDFTKEKLADIVCSLARKVDNPYQQIYWQISRGTGLRQHIACGNYFPNLWVMIRPQRPRTISDTYKLVSHEDCRHSLCDVKTLNLLPNILASTYANERGADECILVRDGVVKECAHSGICYLKGGKLVLPVFGNACLRGVAMDKVRAVATGIGLEVCEEDFGLSCLHNADEVLVCSSGAQCMRVVSIDGMRVGGKGGEIVEHIQRKIVEDFESLR